MANITGANAKGWKESQIVYGVFWRRSNEKHESPAPILIYTTEAEAIAALDGKIDNPLVHNSASNIVSGAVRQGRTIKGSTQVEALATIHQRGKRF